MPQRLVCTAQDTIGWQPYELPSEIPADHIRVRATHGAEKHGTMGAFIHGHANKRGQWNIAKGMFVPGGVAWDYPIPLGNMQVGMVEEVGSQIKAYREGDRILYFGPFAPSALVGETNTWKLSSETNWKSAVCLDPAIYGLCALRDSKARLGDAVAIFSLGALGLMAVQLAKLAGCSPIIAIDPVEQRRKVALATGADLAIDPRGADVGAMLREATGWRGVDAVIDYSGAMEAIQAGLRGVVLGGNVVLGGFPGPMKAGLDLGAEAHLNRPNIIFSRSDSDPSRDHPGWSHERVTSTALNLITRGLIRADAIVTPVLKFSDDLPEQYREVTANPETSIKLGVEYS